MKKRPSLTVWILIALVAGIAFGAAFPGPAKELGLLGTIFLRLIKSIIAPLLFATLVVGIAGTGSIKTMGRIGGKAILYFEIVTTLALVSDWARRIWFSPARASQLQAGAAPGVATAGASLAADRRAHLPHQHHRRHGSRRSAPDRGVLVPVRSGLRGHRRQSRAPWWTSAKSLSEVMFRYTNYVMLFAPLGVFGAMAATIGDKGLGRSAESRQAGADALRHADVFRRGGAGHGHRHRADSRCAASSAGCASRS